jgi:DNA-directed RNA polymerase specialized sigma24 family protein
MATTDGYEADLLEVQAMLDQEIDAEDRDDPTLLYVRATQLHARYTAALAELTRLRAEAVHRMNLAGSSYAQIAATTGLSKPRVQQLVGIGRDLPPMPPT